MNRRELLSGMAGLAALGAVGASRAAGEGGGGPILVGQSAPFDGPSALLGKEMKQGMDACFHAVNKAGGVHGCKIELRSLNDGYEPARALANVQQLHADGVFGFCGNVGTPTSLKVLPFVSAMGLPFVGAFTGASKLREPNRVVFNVRASYEDEAPAIVKQLTSFSDQARIALFIQDDTYGDAVQGAVEKALRELGLAAPVVVAKVPRNATGAQLDAAIAKAASQIAGAKATGVAMGSVYGACARLIVALRGVGAYPLCASVSFVGTSYLLDYPGPAVIGMGIAQVMPAPMYPTLKLTQDYARAMADVAQPRLTYGSIEGYVAARTFVAGLHRAGPGATREKFITALESPLDLGDFTLGFSRGNHNGSKFVDMVVVADSSDGGSKRILR